MINIYAAVTQSPWVGWIVGIGLVAGALLAIIRFVPPAWRTLVRFVNTINSLADLPQFMITTAATLHEQDDQIAEIHHEVQFNNGSSVKDAVRRVETGVAGIYDRLDAADKDRAELREDLEQTKPRPPARKRTTKPKETP